MAVVGPQYKVILLGDPGVGKTTFFLQLRDSSFVDTESRPSASLGVEDMEYKHLIGDTEVTCYLHDTGGGERFRTLTSNFYRNASAAILMYSVEDKFTFENLQEWIENATDSIDDIDNFVWALVGNKSDLPLEIEHDTILARQEQLLTNLSFFTSARTGENVTAAFERIIESIHLKRLGGGGGGTGKTKNSSAKTSSVKIGSTRSDSHSAKNCCVLS